MHIYTYICTCFMRIHIYALNNNNKYASCTFAHYRRISWTHACPTIMYVSWMYLYIYLWCLVTKRTIMQSNNAIIIIFICFYLIVVSLFVTFCDIHCNSLAEFVSSIILHCKHNSSRRFYILMYEIPQISWYVLFLDLCIQEEYLVSLLRCKLCK